MTLNPDLIERAVRALSDADALIVTAGAGMGVDSGLPDFRGGEGFWRAYPALKHEGFSFHEIASPTAFRDHPRLAWGFYGHRLALYRSTIPHKGFEILLRWARAMSKGGFVFTSNVDGQFQKAGFQPDRIVECHGSIHFLQCLADCGGDSWAADSFVPVIDEVECRLVGDLPTCQHCGGLARPNILMFDDWDWAGGRYDRQREALNSWISGAPNIAIIEIGAGTAIPTVRVFSERIGGSLIRINMREADARRADAISLQGAALDVLRALDRVL